MKLFNSISETREYRQALSRENGEPGFVPTMGALHSGHLSLVKRAREECRIVAVSIFVNPIQFNDPNDLVKYPRNIQRDLEMLGEYLSDEDFVFIPGVKEMYPEPVLKKYDFGPLENVMEGSSRPGHFNGVGVVVDRLFRIIEPGRAYFGEKDFQQIAVIKRMTELEKLPVSIIPCPIIREDNGLAKSSRNVLLPPHVRLEAGIIFKALKEAQELSLSKTVAECREILTDMISLKPGFSVEYIVFADEETLQPVSSWEGAVKVRCFIAVKAGGVRLIDNMGIESRST